MKKYILLFLVFIAITGFQIDQDTNTILYNQDGVVITLLDEDKIAYKDFVKNFPFISTCDYQKWDSKIVKDYYVFGTPTMYLLDNNREILLRPNSVNQMDSWVDWYLIEGNK